MTHLRNNGNSTIKPLVIISDNIQIITENIGQDNSEACWHC